MIYRGETVPVDGASPADALANRQFETLSLIARGLSAQEVGDEMGVTILTAKSQIRDGYKKLRISARPQLAAYFPLDAEDELVRDKKLADLGKGSRRLGVLQAFSIGLSVREAAARLTTSEAAISSSIYQTGLLWPDAKAMVTATAVANAIRAAYVPTIEYEDISELTLPALKAAEPVILHRRRIEARAQS